MSYGESSLLSGDIQAEEALELYNISPEDLERIKNFRVLAEPKLTGVLDDWYEWVMKLPEAEQFFAEPGLMNRVKKSQHDYWKTFLAGSIDAEYLESRRRIGVTHARIGLSLSSYFAGVNMFQILFDDLLRNSKSSDLERFENQESIVKLLHLDVAIVVETYNSLVEETLTAQASSLMEMSTPVTEIWNGVLLLPIVGLIDSKRSGDIMNAVLRKIGESQARMFILDISGVGMVDTAVANHLIKITRATRLMGCECTISGVSPSIAQTIVDLGIEVGRVKTTANMRDALADSFRRIGLEIGRPAKTNG